MTMTTRKIQGTTNSLLKFDYVKISYGDSVFFLGAVLSLGTLVRKRKSRWTQGTHRAVSSSAKQHGILCS